MTAVFAFNDWPTGRHPGWPARLGPVQVAAGQVALRPVRLRDGAAWSRLRLRDEAYLRPWEPEAEGAWVERSTTMTWPVLCSGQRATARRGQALPFGITLDGQLAGQLTLGNVVRGSLRSAWVGYWVESTVAGGGVATAAVALAVDHAFGPVGLHRVEATVRPENVASLRVLAKLGFRDEGLLRRYLEVDGAWRDHQLLALLEDEVGAGLVSRLIRAGYARHP
ncbi:MAG TPA: GNAT family protein [Pseudonocardiaceae bacterium]|nr:GNAT family protein [Pseudonocardiaceae bacterium]